MYLVDETCARMYNTSKAKTRQTQYSDT